MGALWGLVAIVFLIIAIRLLLAAADMRPSSFRSRFERDRDLLLDRATRPDAIVADSDLAGLPPLMQAYLRRAGVPGRARVRNMRVTFDAKMRSSASSSWMPSTATQYEFFSSSSRLFHMRARRLGVTFDVLHRYIDGNATFQVRIAGLFTAVDKKGAGITNDETVTLMNDILVLAPAAVLDLPFIFVTTGDHTVHATFRNAGYSVSADLVFDGGGDLVGFRSSDRAHDREGGPAVWSTPISGYRVIDGIRVGTLGDANWIEADGREWTYGRFVLTSIAYNVSR